MIRNLYLSLDGKALGFLLAGVLVGVVFTLLILL